MLLMLGKYDSEEEGRMKNNASTSPVPELRCRCRYEAVPAIRFCSFKGLAWLAPSERGTSGVVSFPVSQFRSYLSINVNECFALLLLYLHVLTPARQQTSLRNEHPTMVRSL